MSVIYKDIITIREVFNDCKTINLYYSRSQKAFVAYGMSAYFASRLLPSLAASYSADMQMPILQLTDSQADNLKRCLRMVLPKDDYYCRLVIDRVMDEAGYGEWAGSLRQGEWVSFGENDFE